MSTRRSKRLRMSHEIKKPCLMDGSGDDHDADKQVDTSDGDDHDENEKEKLMEVDEPTTPTTSADMDSDADPAEKIDRDVARIVNARSILHFAAPPSPPESRIRRLQRLKLEESVAAISCQKQQSQHIQQIQQKQQPQSQPQPQSDQPQQPVLPPSSSQQDQRQKQDQPLQQEDGGSVRDQDDQDSSSQKSTGDANVPEPAHVAPVFDVEIECWCCGMRSRSPNQAEGESGTYPLFCASFSPVWMLPALHCANRECPARSIGSRAPAYFGPDLTSKNNGILIAVFYRRTWTPVRAFMRRPPSTTPGNSDADITFATGEAQNPVLVIQSVTRSSIGVIRPVQDCLGAERLALAILYRVIKPFDDYTDAIEQMQNDSVAVAAAAIVAGKRKQQLEQLEGETKDDGENENVNANANAGTADAPISNEDEVTTKTTRPAAPDRILKYGFAKMPALSDAGMDLSARMVWVDNEAVGFYTYATKLVPCASLQQPQGTPTQQQQQQQQQQQHSVLPYMGAMFVRRKFRRRGLARAMIHEFFRELAPRLACPAVDIALVRPAYTSGVHPPLTTTLLAVLADVLNADELDRIVCAHMSAPIDFAVSIRHWVLFQEMKQRRLREMNPSEAPEAPAPPDSREKSLSSPKSVMMQSSAPLSTMQAQKTQQQLAV